MSRKFAVVYEAAADFAIATELADRVLVESVDWLDETLLDSQREWVGGEAAGRLTWKAIAARAREARIRVHGHFDGEPGMPDAQAARRALAYLLRRFDDLEAVVLMRDADDQPERRRARAGEGTVRDGVPDCDRRGGL